MRALYAYASVNKILNGPDNGLSYVWRQAIIWNNDVLMSITAMGTIFREIN